MNVSAIKTRKFLPPKDDLWQVLDSSINELQENSVVAVTSKIVSIAEGRCVSINETTKDAIAMEEADKFLPREFAPDGLVLHTIKDNMLIASSGVDESNGDGFYILWPKDPQKSAKEIWQFLKNKFNLKNLGIIITDSRLVPLRRGVVGIAISFYGFKPLKDYRGKKDIFGREFQMETSNMPDSLATVAVLVMGEGNETKPIAIIEDIPDIEFTDLEFTPATPDDAYEIPEKEDMFYPFLSSVKWEKGKGGKN